MIGAWFAMQAIRSGGKKPTESRIGIVVERLESALEWQRFDMRLRNALARLGIDAQTSRVLSVNLEMLVNEEPHVCSSVEIHLSPGNYQLMLGDSVFLEATYPANSDYAETQLHDELAYAISDHFMEGLELDFRLSYLNYERSIAVELFGLGKDQQLRGVVPLGG